MRIGFDVAHAVVVHNAHVATAECVGHCEGYFGFGFDDAGAHFLNAGGHFLFECNGHCSAFFGARLCDVFVGFGLVCLEFCTDVVAHIHVGDVDGEDFVGGARVEALVEYGFGNHVGIFEYVFVGFCGADGGDNAFAHAGHDGFFTCTADQAFYVGANCDARGGFDLYAVFGNGGDHGGGDDFGVDADLHGFEYVAPGKVNGGGAFGCQADARFVCGDECVDDVFDMTSRQIVGFEKCGGNVEARFGCVDLRAEDDARGDATQAHADEFANADAHARSKGRDPEADGDEVKEEGESQNSAYNNEEEKNDVHKKSSLKMVGFKCLLSFAQ